VDGVDRVDLEVGEGGKFTGLFYRFMGSVDKIAFVSKWKSRKLA